ncbi:srs2 [Candida jiufengensis]|uniref:srs2 n=1 Tax=Candida jiufengensis TaxID=497108 RepID=UPI002224350D|nr:srs2 [Candida jiufengensis]KAI5952549.1 srs2 [Candida jiufengensis]
MSFIDNPKLKFLKDLNPEQYKAVTSPVNGRLQIIAGPGTGKTKVLTSRVAFLLLQEKIKPEQIIVTTFTKKAANEMIERLDKLLINTNIDISRLLIGTFHSICFKILKKYGFKLNLSDFNIADERDKDHYLKEVLTKELTLPILNYMQNTPKELDLIRSKSPNKKYHDIDINKLKRQISKLKSNGYLPDEYKIRPDSNRVLYFLYEAYQRKLQEDEKKLDFDDCLLYCNILLTKWPFLHFIKHVLVDEFQDTNKIQLQLMYSFAKGHLTNEKFQNNVTIVGDPDQSIYGFRDAQTTNFRSMRDHYSQTKSLSCEIITLNENYRSTNDILKFSESIMRQESDRITKNLNSQFNLSIKPVFKNANSSENEAQKIVYEIKYLLSLPQQPIKPNDIAILLRSGFQSSVIEKELVSQKIPYFMVRGKAFWDKKEVVAIMDYLKACGDPNDRISIMRTINFPKRGIGAKTLDKIDDAITQSKREQNSARECLKQLAENRHSSEKLSIKVRSGLQSYLDVIEGGFDLLPENLKDTTKPTEILHEELFDFVYEKSGLKKEYEDDPEANADKIENIEEVKRQFVDFVKKDDIFYEEDEEIEVLDNRNTIIQFIESIGLYESSEEDKKDEQDSNATTSPTPKISLSTIHGSKGLEWPVVFIPGLTDGLLPAKYATGETAVDEERRCFYVAVTRAKTLLYITNYIEESGSHYETWRQNYNELSVFIKDLKDSRIFENNQSSFKNIENLKKMYDLLGVEDNSILDNFNIDNFYKGYCKNWVSFERGAPFSTEYNGSSSSSLGGFKSASSVSSTNVKRRKFSAGRTSLSRQNQPPNPFILTTNNTNVSTTSSTSGPKSSNKAPAYVPMRDGSSKKLGMKRY